jgi:environmental stress-induced protein Ves
VIGINYSVEILRKNEFEVSTWSGGSTTQLYIFPRDALYSEREFKWRLSSAKVEVEESVFTPLPGFSRIIMVIEGEIHLEHQGHHSAVLKDY